MKKGKLTVLLAIIIGLLVTFAVVACDDPQDPNEGMQFEYSQSGDYYELVGYLGDKSNLVLPAQINGVPLKSIGEQAFAYCSNLVSVDIPFGVTSIGKEAFLECDKLREISLPCSVTSIGEQAFAGCDSLIRATVPHDVESIGNGAFAGCELLTNLEIEHGVQAIGDNAFLGCDNLISVILPSSITSIGAQAFADCDSLISIAIPAAVESVGKGAFWHCDSLSSINVEKDNLNYASIDGNLYSKDGSVLIQYAIGKADKTATLPDSVLTISENAFSSCESVISMVVGANLIRIETSAFLDSRLANIFTKGNYNQWNEVIVQSFNDIVLTARVFYYSETEPAISKYSQDYDGDYWYYNDGEVDVWSDYELGYIQSGSEGLIYYGYEDDEHLDESDIVTVANIGRCIDEDVVIPDFYRGLPVKKIYYEAFANCRGVTSVTMGENVAHIDYYAFSDCVYLKSVCISGKEVEIWDGAFYGCTALSEVTLGEGVTSIGVFAFRDCVSLQSIVLPSTLTYIGYSGFAGCSGLKEVLIPSSVTQMGTYAFFGCVGLEKVEIGDGLETVDHGVFFGCTNLKSVIIGEGVTRIEGDAFDQCDNVQNIFYKGTEYKWSSVSVGANWMSQATIYFYNGLKPQDEGNYWHYGPNGDAVIWE